MATRLIKCARCEKNATWEYMGGTGVAPACDDCVHRGCECNYRFVDVNAYTPPLTNPDMPEGEENVDWKWIEKDKVWVSLDEKGREYPCCEYDYDENGFEIDDEPEIDKNVSDFEN